MSESLVIVGNGMAAAKLVENISTRALGRYAIAECGDRPEECACDEPCIDECDACGGFGYVD